MVERLRTIHRRLMTPDPAWPVKLTLTDAELVSLRPRRQQCQRRRQGVAGDGDAPVAGGASVASLLAQATGGEAERLGHALAAAPATRPASADCRGGGPVT